MSDEELRAAAERVLAYFKTLPCLSVMFQDAADVARAYLAAHPADDAEPVTIANLRAAGFMDFTEPDKYCEAYLSFWLDRREHNVAILGVHWARPDSRDGSYWSANGFTLYKGAHPKTMGDVRRLIRALVGASVG